MLDHTQLAVVLYALSDELFADMSHEYDIIRQVWERIVKDPTFVYMVQEVSAPWPVPTWFEQLNRTYTIKPYKNPYYALSIDGSQIYPDRHQSVSCYLINIGSVVIPYDIADTVVLSSEPYVFQDRDTVFDHATSHDMVNAKRQELELQKGCEIALNIQQKIHASHLPLILLFDGSLIFWHVSSHEETARKSIVAHYCSFIMQMYEQRIVCAWYISMPKSKELINLIRLSLCDFIPERKELYACVDRFVDTSIAQLYIKPYERSIIFKNNAPVSKEYPSSIAPYFFYINVGDEIGRVEIPAWIAQDSALIDLISQVIIDQCIKGQGYPLVLAEAHEQAVIKGADRDLFYHLIQKIGLQYDRRPIISKKSFKKQRVSF